MSGEYVGWTPPPGIAVVASPVHPETVVNVIYSDLSDDIGWLARDLNWSSVGDGPSIVAYCIVEEYKPAPCADLTVTEAQLNRWIVAMGDWDRGGADAIEEMEALLDRREVQPEAREVVAWAVVGDGFATCFYEKKWADNFVEQRGGTVVKLTGVMPNE